MENPQALVDILTNLVPEMILTAGACAIFLGGTFSASRRLWAESALTFLLLALAALIWGRPAALADGDLQDVPVLFDALATFTRVLAIATGIVLVLLSWNKFSDSQAADYHANLLVMVAGTGLLGAANDLVTIFLALELVSIPTYIVLYLPKYDDASQEATLKYFLISVFSSALVLFGFSYLYGITGTTNVTQIQAMLNPEHPEARPDLPVLAAVALITIVAGVGYRITAAPFHFYAPDVYQGAPTVGAALLAYEHKIVGFVMLLRVLGFVLPPDVTPRVGIGTALSDQVPILFWFLAALSMFWGNLLALVQDNLKRLLAYSGVAHGGYMLITLATAPYLREQAGGVDGVEALLYYLVAYGAMTLGAFAVLAYLSTPEQPIETTDDLAGLSTSHPVVAMMMALFLFSLIGIPLTAGFTGKFLVFFGAMSIPGDQEHAYLYWILALLGVINAAIGAWYYLRLVAVMYLRSPLVPITPRRNLPGLATLTICGILTVGLSMPPGSTWLLHAVRQAAGTAGDAAALARR
jgi:NADH-quinone oxidoreductase subunit N